MQPHVAAFGPPRAQFCGSTEPTRAETNACQTASHHARCSASSAASMPTAIGSSARRRLRLLRTTRPRLSVSRATSGVHQHLPTHPSVPAICRIVTTPPRRRRKHATPARPRLALQRHTRERRGQRRGGRRVGQLELSNMLKCASPCSSEGILI